MLKADLHIHTTYSYDGTATVPAVLEYVKRHTDLDVIAITDHDEIDGALEAVELAPRYGIDIIPGIEVSTAEGHLLALFVTQLVPPNLSLIETVYCVREMGGVCVAAHPGGRWSWCLSEATLQAALQRTAIAETLVGLECYNASLPNLHLNAKAAAMNQRLALAAVANSDAHMPWMIGVAATTFPGHRVIDLRTALKERTTTTVIAKRSGLFLASYLKGQLLRQLGLAQCSLTTPGGPVVLRRLANMKSLGPTRQPALAK